MKRKHSSWGPLGKDVIYLQILRIEAFDDYRVIVNIDMYDYFFKKKVKVCLNVFIYEDKNVSCTFSETFCLKIKF